MINSLDVKIKDYTEFFDFELKKYINQLKKLDITNKILEAMEYSLFAGGKRVRPILAFLFNEFLGGSKEKILPFAIAIELIHTYSLIHDDLPAMDNDDFRRGKPTSHKKFGEAIAILAGDALLNQAFELSINSIVDKQTLKCANILSKYAGIQGMIGGQVQDILSENSKNLDGSTLEYIITNKTAKLIKAPIEIASAINEDKYLDKLTALGDNIGFLFQITDDILDVESSFEKLGKTIGKDKKFNKFTSVNFYGLTKAKEMAKTYYQNSINLLNSMPSSQILIDFVTKIYNRTH